MDDKRGRERLKELFSDLEVLVANPAGKTLEIRGESETPAAQVGVMEYASPNEKVEAYRVPTSPMPDNSIEITSPRQPTLQIVPPPQRQLAAHDPSLADWKDFGIGVIVGTLVTGIILASTSQMDVFNKLGKFALLGGEVLLSVLGAFAAKSWSKTRRDVWVGAIEWSLIPVWIGLIIILLLYLLSFTNIFIV
jgi:hypothetical protein